MRTSCVSSLSSDPKWSNRGLSGNENARADIHDGPEQMLQSKAGYIDARPLTASSTNLLQRTAGPYIRVKPGNARGEQMFSALLPNSDIAFGMVSKVPDSDILTTAMRHDGSASDTARTRARGVCRSQFDDQRRRPKQPYSGRCDDHLVAKCLATANAPRSLVSRAIFCASITSPATR
jgi:hypothetical protein